jgi:NCS1 family nucleobase:cation symporter-1
MDWKQAVGTVLLGNLIVLVPMLLNAHAGAKYGIPFPVFIRAPFGVRGANIPAILRADSCLRLVWHPVLDRRHRHLRDACGDLAICRRPKTAVLWASFLGFWLLNMVVVWRGVESIRRLQAVGAPLMFVMSAERCSSGSGFQGRQLRRHALHAQPIPLHGLVSRRLLSLAHRHGRLLGYARAQHFPTSHATPSPRAAQAWGQAFGLPVAMVLYTFVGIAVTSASTVLFGHAIWNPIALIGAFHQPVVAFIALIAILIATLNVNIGANVVSPSNDFSNLYPRLISFRTGGLITGFLGLAMCPWKLLATPDAYIFGWLVGYSGLLGPVAGIMISDYFLIRKTELDVNSLYHCEGVYYYTKGINPRAIAALVAGVVIALIGLVVKPLHFLYDYAWFVGFFVAGIVYVALMCLAAPTTSPPAAKETA